MALLVATELEFAEPVEKYVRIWNEFLRTQTIEFGSSSKEATMLLSLRIKSSRTCPKTLWNTISARTT
jgi:hypothetical protein